MCRFFILQLWAVLLPFLKKYEKVLVVWVISVYVHINVAAFNLPLTSLFLCVWGRYPDVLKLATNYVHGSIPPQVCEVFVQMYPLTSAVCRVCIQLEHATLSPHYEGPTFAYGRGRLLWHHQQPHQPHRPPKQQHWLICCAPVPAVNQSGGIYFVCVLTLFILATVNMWCLGFLSPGLGGYCGGKIGGCGRPPWAAHRKKGG